MRVANGHCEEFQVLDGPYRPRSLSARPRFASERGESIFRSAFGREPFVLNPSKFHKPLRFGTRSLLLAIALCCSLLAPLANRVHAQKQAVRAVENAGGRIGYNYHVNWWYQDAYGKHQRTPPERQTWSDSDNLHRVRFVDLRGCRITDELCRHLAEFRYLSLIDLNPNTPTNDVRALKSAFPGVDVRTALSDSDLELLQLPSTRGRRLARK